MSTNDLVERLKREHGRQYVQDRINGLINIKRTHAIVEINRNMRLATSVGFPYLNEDERKMLIDSVMALDPAIESVVLS